MRSLLPLLVASLFLLHPGSTLGWSQSDPNYYTYYPGSTLTLGSGFSPNDLSQAKIRCIEFEASPAEAGALGTKFGAAVVTDTESLKTAIELDAKIDASYLVFKGGATFGLEQSRTFAKDSLSIVVSAATEFGRLTMKNPKLTAEAVNLLGNAKTFEQACGSRFVIMERRGAAVWGLVQIQNITKDSLTKIQTSLSAGGGGKKL